MLFCQQVLGSYPAFDLNVKLNNLNVNSLRRRSEMSLATAPYEGDLPDDTQGGLHLVTSKCEFLIAVQNL